ncbi:MAG TPA: ROK family transcriptional regulator [Jatrophihabitantaceae bacterium]|jgi:predicted NBD/HSP70 family sugar kinase|nr:ROK family transcriptional regulator [Jatrophihabitantaceae bacterium]
MNRARSAVRPDAIRRHNLSLLLEEIHHEGKLTRAELTQRIGLNRSTIGALVGDLTDLGLLAEQVPTSTNDRAGRPSHLVGPRPDGPFVLAIDLEVDRLASAAVGLGGHVIARLESSLGPAERTPAHVAALVAADADQLLRGAEDSVARVVGVGVSIPGTVTRDGKEIALSPNLDWRDVGFADLVAKHLANTLKLALPVELGNDANLGVMAEHVRGSARGSDDVVYLTGRTGVGAGILVNGSALRGFQGLAGEVGHMVLDPAGPRCHCGNDGCIETYVGAPAVLAAAGCPIPLGRESLLWLDQSLAAGETGAVAGIRAIAEPLGRTIANLVNMLNPERIVLGGVLAKVLQTARAEVESALHKHAFDDSRGVVDLRAAGLGEDSSLMGAAELAFQQLLNNPFLRA